MITLWWLYPRLPFIGKEWFRDPKEGGLFLDAGSHCFDYLRWVAGAEPTRLYAQIANYNHDSETPRSTMTTLSFANGVMAHAVAELRSAHARLGEHRFSRARRRRHRQP